MSRPTHAMEHGGNRGYEKVGLIADEGSCYYVGMVKCIIALTVTMEVHSILADG